MRWLSTVLLLLTLLTQLAPAPPAPARPANVAPAVWQATANGGQADFLVVLAEQADLSGAERLTTQAARGRFVVERLRETAQRTQAGLRALLERRGVDYQPFYIVNMLRVTSGRSLLTALAARPEVARIVANPRVRADLPPLPTGPNPTLPAAVEWNVQWVHADDAWALGYTGEGVVVAGADTGYDWDHPALLAQYRGWDGATVSHDTNWHDAIHSGGGSCGPDSPEPCDDYGHGTHTMGTIVGDDGAGNQVGVAPGARWIGCRNMNVGYGTPASYAECFEFFIAPYPLGGDPAQGDPALAPDVINNSWSCPPSEGCDVDTLQAIIEATRAAGIMVVASASNDGPTCSSIQYPPSVYAASFVVGATNYQSDAIASFSSRGPVTADESGRRKPDVSAPGVTVRSSLNGGGYGTMSGTSMAAPHVAGVAALVWSAAPHLIGQVGATEQVITQTARPQTTAQGCGGDGPTDVPNNVYGWGIVDALVAVVSVRLPLTVTLEATLLPGVPPTRLAATLTVTSSAAVTLTGVVLTSTLPVSTTLAWASGVYTETGGVVSWAPTTLGAGGRLTATLVVTLPRLAPASVVTNEWYGVRADGVPAVTGPAVKVVIPWQYVFVMIRRE